MANNLQLWPCGTALGESALTAFDWDRYPSDRPRGQLHNHLDQHKVILHTYPTNSAVALFAQHK